MCRNYFFLIFTFFPASLVYSTSWSEDIQVPGVGYDADGADLAITNLDNNSRPEMVVLAYDSPKYENSFRYRIGWNLNGQGIAEKWSSVFQVPGVGHHGDGAGIEMFDLDNNSRPEMLVMAYDAPKYNNSFRYRIGWNLNGQGIAEKWSSVFQVPGVGHHGDGAGLAISNLDSNHRPELILMAYDNPKKANSFRYKIGWNLNVNGVAEKWDSRFISVSGLGDHGDGAGLELINMDGNPQPEMILMAYDNPKKTNNFRYKIGWNLNSEGVAEKWTSYHQISGVGIRGDGAGVAVTNLNNDLRSDWIFMAYDNPKKANSFRYKIGWDYSQPMEDKDHQFVGYVSNEEGRFKDYVWGFVDEFENTWDKTQYFWGECRFLGEQHLSFVDSADLAYIAGHGSPSYISMSSGEGCNLVDKAWGSYSTPDGRGDLEYIVFHSCSVMAMDQGWRSRWRHYESTKNEKRPFSGLHVAMGFRTSHFNGVGAGRWAADEFAENLEDGYSVRYAWYEAAEDARWLAGWKQNKPAVFYIRPHKDERVSEHNSEDYGYGSPLYFLDAYYMK